MPLRAVTFDLWETLIVDRVDRGSERTGRRVRGTVHALRRAGWDVDEERVRGALHANIRAMSELRAAGIDVNSDQQVRRFLDRIATDLADRLPPEVLESVIEAYTSLDPDVAPEAIEGAREALDAARELDLRIGLISNTGTTPGRVLRRILADYNLIAYFDVLTFSDEVAMAKPEPRIFLETLARLGVEPAAAAHVGDHGRWDVAGARAAGMRVIQVLRRSRPPDPDAEPTREAAEELADVTVESLYDVPPILNAWVSEDRP